MCTLTWRCRCPLTRRCRFVSLTCRVDWLTADGKMRICMDLCIWPKHMSLGQNMLQDYKLRMKMNDLKKNKTAVLKGTRRKRCQDYQSQWKNLSAHGCLSASSGIHSSITHAYQANQLHQTMIEQCWWSDRTGAPFMDYVDMRWIRQYKGDSKVCHKYVYIYIWSVDIYCITIDVSHPKTLDCTRPKDYLCMGYWAWHERSARSCAWFLAPKFPLSFFHVHSSTRTRGSRLFRTERNSVTVAPQWRHLGHRGRFHQFPNSKCP